MKSLVCDAPALCRASHPSRGAWIEIVAMDKYIAEQASHPSRGAWIEIIGILSSKPKMRVAPLAGCVD